MGGSESEGREDEKKSPKAGMLNVVGRIEGKGGVKESDSLKLTKIISGQVGEVNIFGDIFGELDNSDVKVKKAKKMSLVFPVGGKRIRGCKGVISGVPFGVNMRELVENLRGRNATVKNVERMKE